MIWFFIGLFVGAVVVGPITFIATLAMCLPRWR